MTDLGTLGEVFSKATTINNAGRIVLHGQKATHAFVTGPMAWERPTSSLLWVEAQVEPMT
jgi:uncharacterized membrane protein